MTQSAMESAPAGLHVAIIMDGNGRWANARGWPRGMGHREGARVVRGIVEEAPSMGIGVMTLYAFSSDNWRRPRPEVGGLMRLFRSYLASETARCVQNGVRMCVVGRRDRLPAALLRAIETAETATAGGTRMLLRIAIDYSARDAMLQAATRLDAVNASREAFTRLLNEAIHSPATPDVDLLVRTGGEQRLSDFLLWECAYAELYFDPCLWPEFSSERLAVAVQEFGRRERRFGGVPAAAAG